jgi:hypothetical protein
VRISRRLPPLEPEGLEIARSSNSPLADGVGNHSIERSRVRLPVGEIRSDHHRHREGRLVVTCGNFESSEDELVDLIARSAVLFRRAARTFSPLTT